MVAPMISISFGAASAGLALLSALTGAGGLTLLDRAFAGRERRMGRSAVFALGVLSLAVAVAAIFEACELFRMAEGLA